MVVETQENEEVVEAQGINSRDYGGGDSGAVYRCRNDHGEDAEEALT